MRTILVSLFAVVASSSGLAQLSSPLSSLELFFEPEPRDAGAAFFSRGEHFQFTVMGTGVEMMLCNVSVNAPANPHELHMPGNLYSVSARRLLLELKGANVEAVPNGTGLLRGKMNYLIGSDSEQWRTGVPTYARVLVKDVYPGIDVSYYGNHQQLEYDFELAAGAEPERIAIRFHGADKLSLDDAGGLVVSLGQEHIRQPPPCIYQVIRGERRSVKGGYRLLDQETVTFGLGAYDHKLPLVIDPVLAYASYFGGNASDLIDSVKVDPNSGAVYVAGLTTSARFSFSNSIPANGFPGGYTNTFQGGPINGDGFVARFVSGGTNLVLDYFTYLGGSFNDGIYDMALAADGSGAVYVTGFTDSTNFPVAPARVGVSGLPTRISGASDPSLHVFPVDAFVACLAPNGAGLLYSTYLGGNASDIGDAITVDAAGTAYVGGYTFSTNFPLTNGYQTRIGSTNHADGFLATISPGSGGPYLSYSTYFGGTNTDEVEGIAVDTGGFTYLAGYTDSTNIPRRLDALQVELNGSTNAAVEFRKNPSPPLDAFIARFDTRAAGVASLIYSTYLGGTNSDAANRIVVDTATNLYVAGYTYSQNFINTASNTIARGFAGTNKINADAFLTKIDFSKVTPALVYSAVFGGRNDDNGWGVAVDAAGNAFVTGNTISTNFPITNVPASLALTNAGANNVFVTAFNPDASALIYSGVIGGSRDDFGYGISLNSFDDAFVVGRTVSTNFPVTANAFSPALQRTNNSFLALIEMDRALLGTVAGSNIELKWGASLISPQYHLQTSPVDSGGWSNIVAPSTVVNGYNAVTLPLTNGIGFFRLER